MAKKIDLMETGISLSRLFRLAFQNYQVILYSFALGLLLSFGYTSSNLMDRGTYQSSGTVAYKISTNATVLNTVVEIAKSNTVVNLAVEALDELEIVLANGNPISASTISSTLTATTTTNSLRITISFTHPEEEIVIPVINAIIDATISDGNANHPVIANNLVLGEYASITSFDGPSSTLYLAIGSLLGLMIGGAVGVLWDAFKGTIYSALDIKEFGLSAFYLPLVVKRKLTLNIFLSWFGFYKYRAFELEQTKLILHGLVPSPAFTTIQNNLESTRPQPQDPLTTLIVTPVSNTSLSMVAFAYARQSSTQGRKTLLIDFDLKDIPFTKYLDTNKIETKKKPSTKEGLSFLSLEENLDLYLPLQDIIPAKVIRDEATQELIAQVKKKYDHIIVMGPSVLPDASVLSMVQYVNSSLVVAKAGVTTTTQVIQAVNTLIDANINAIETLIVDEVTQTQWPSLVMAANANNPNERPRPTKAKVTKKK